MNELQALVLGVVQGLTEFLPISSSGHLILVPWLLDFDYLQTHPAFNKTFDVAIHIGTLAAVVTYFRSTIYELSLAFVGSIRSRSIKTKSERLAWYIAIATVPAAAVGAIGESFIEDKLGQPWQIAILLAVFGLVLWWADSAPQSRGLAEMNVKSALIIGAAQVISLAPGTSRSGITITAGRFLHLSRDAAARFSFLMLAPITFGAGLVKGLDVIRDGLPPGSTGPFVIGIISAAVSGTLAIWGLLALVRRHSYAVFVWYRFALAAIILLLIATSVKSASFS